MSVCGFNTSHVKVYRFTETREMKTSSCFNTSHVKVYLKYSHASTGFWHVSIHPMLKFIVRDNWLSKVNYGVSIHPMLKFINNAAFLLSVSALVSIHPMLKFIYCEHFSLKLLNTCFNTSHVKVYPTASAGLIGLIKFQYIPC